MICKKKRDGGGRRRQVAGGSSGPGSSTHPSGAVRHQAIKLAVPQFLCPPCLMEKALCFPLGCQLCPMPVTTVSGSFLETGILALCLWRTQRWNKPPQTVHFPSLPCYSTLSREPHPPCDPVLHFWEQIWPFLTLFQGIQDPTADCRAVGLFQREQHFFDNSFPCNDPFSGTSFKTPLATTADFLSHHCCRLRCSESQPNSGCCSGRK